MVHSIQILTENIKQNSAFLHLIYREMGKNIIGQKDMIDSLLMALLANGHVLMEGVPGLAKTTAIKALAEVSQVHFSRIQFTPDLLPADILGTQIYEPKTGDFRIKKGPIFSNFVLADEINRAPAKVQSALLETMQERQVTIAGETFPLESPFLVLATQNPLEHEGTYPLPEAQVDRFLLKIKVDYLTPPQELEMIKRLGDASSVHAPLQPLLSVKDLLEARTLVDSIHVEEALMEYIVKLVFATRRPADYGLADFKNLITCGASPRASLGLLRCAKARAYLNQRGFVIPQDIKDVSFQVLRHRILLSYQAEAEAITSEAIIQRILDHIPTP